MDVAFRSVTAGRPTVRIGRSQKRRSQIPRDRGKKKKIGKFIRRPYPYTKLYCGYRFEKFEFLGGLFQ